MLVYNMPNNIAESIVLVTKQYVPGLTPEILIKALRSFENDPKDKIANQLLRVQEAADILGCCTKTVRNLIERGDLDKVYIGSAVRVTESSLDSYILRGQVK